MTCGHVLHPSTSEDCEYCPVCIMIIYLKALWLVTDAWDQIGGPWHETTNVQLYKQLRRTWTRFRLEVEQLITSLEDEVDKEIAWEASQTSCDTRDSVHAAINAVQIARTFARYPAAGVLGASPRTKARSSNTQLSLLKPRMPERKLRFAAMATDVEDGSIVGDKAHRSSLQSPVNFGPGRPFEQWERTNENYVSGAHAAPSLEGWSNTSFMDDVLYDLSQPKVYINISPFQLERPWTDRYEIESDGLAGEHVFWEEIQSAVHAGLESGALLREKIGHSDCLLVGTRNGIFHEVVLYTTNDDEANDTHETQTKRWTSELETLTANS